MQLLPEHRMHSASLEEDRRGAGGCCYIGGRGKLHIWRWEGNHEEVCDIVPSQVADVLRRHAGFAAVEESPPRMTEEGEERG